LESASKFSKLKSREPWVATKVKVVIKTNETQSRFVVQKESIQTRARKTKNNTQQQGISWLLCRSELTCLSAGS
jgi:hypothetical protein